MNLSDEPAEQVSISAKARFHDKIQTILAKLRQIPPGSTAADDEAAEDDALDELTKVIARFERYERLCNSYVRVGFLGDSGNGKSTIINRLLNYASESLLPESSSPRSVTTTILEVKSWEGDEDDFLIRVEFLTTDELNDLYEIVISDATSSENYDENDEKYATAVFGKLLGQMTTHVKEFARQHSSALECIPDAMRQVFTLGAITHRHALFTNLQDDLKTYASAGTRTKPETWYCLVKKIDVIGPFPDMKGFSLLDIPGSGDGNEISKRRFQQGADMSDILFFVRPANRGFTEEFFQDLVMNVSLYEPKLMLGFCVTRCGDPSILETWRSIEEEPDLDVQDLPVRMKAAYEAYAQQVPTADKFSLHANMFCLENKGSTHSVFKEELQMLRLKLNNFLTDETRWEDRLKGLDSFIQDWVEQLETLETYVAEPTPDELSEIVRELGRQMRDLFEQSQTIDVRRPDFEEWKQNRLEVYKRAKFGVVPWRRLFRLDPSPQIDSRALPFWKDFFTFLLPMNELKQAIMGYETNASAAQKGQLKETLRSSFDKWLQSRSFADASFANRIAASCLDFVERKLEYYGSKAVEFKDLTTAPSSLMLAFTEVSQGRTVPLLRTQFQHPQGKVIDFASEVENFTREKFSLICAKVEELHKTSFMDFYGALRKIIEIDIAQEFHHWFRPLPDNKSLVFKNICRALKCEDLLQLDQEDLAATVERSSEPCSTRLRHLHEFNPLCKQVEHIRLGQYKWKDEPKRFVYLVKDKLYYEKYNIIKVGYTKHEDIRERFKHHHLPENPVLVTAPWSSSHAPLFEKIMKELFSSQRFQHHYGGCSEWFQNAEVEMKSVAEKVRDFVEDWVQEREKSSKPLIAKNFTTAEHDDPKEYFERMDRRTCSNKRALSSVEGSTKKIKT